MRVMALNRVAVSERDIQDFCDKWPASGLRQLKGVTFTFERNGDLVDVHYANGNSERWDGEALAALSDDAKAYLEAHKGDRKRVSTPRHGERAARMVQGPGVTAHYAQNAVWGSVPQHDAIRFASLMSRAALTQDEFKEAREIFGKSRSSAFFEYFAHPRPIAGGGGASAKPRIDARGSGSFVVYFETQKPKTIHRWSYGSERKAVDAASAESRKRGGYVGVMHKGIDVHQFRGGQREPL